MKKLSITLYISFVLCALFTVLNISFALDISLFACIISASITSALIYWTLICFLKKRQLNILPVIRKLYEYLPFVLLGAFVLRRAGESGTSHVFDLISVFLWLAIAICAIIILMLSSHKRIYIQEAKEIFYGKYPQFPLSKPKKIIKEIFEWIDAFIQAAFMVSLINIFIFQLYEIPSESMVSEFLVADKVVVFKTASGPRFPLSDVGIPQMRTYNRGDIVVFRNPHYTKDRSAEIRNFVSQLVYMLTFTAVNLNVDENGNPKADPLVKRVVGTPGEQLVMVDGILYSRTAQNPQFTIVSEDAQWAQWNLNTLDENIKKHVQSIPLSQADYEVMIEIEKERSALSLSTAATQCTEEAVQFAHIRQAFSKNDSTEKTDQQILSLFSPRERMIDDFVFKNEDITRKLLTVDGGLQWFTGFMTDWIPIQPSDYQIANDPYSYALFCLNIMVKQTMGNLIIRNAQLYAQGFSSSQMMQDSQRRSLLVQARKLIFYLQVTNLRNMSVFPPNNDGGQANFIPHNSFFMMGDNRFNSLDMRHSYTYHDEPLVKEDPYTVFYSSNLEPQYINAKDILGTTIFRFWPPARIGIPGK